MNTGEDKYVLEYHTGDDSDPQGPPFKYRSYYLADVLAEAWRIAESGGQAQRVARGRQAVFEGEGLDTMLARLSEQMRAGPDVVLREVAERALREAGRAAGG